MNHREILYSVWVQVDHQRRNLTVSMLVEMADLR